MRRISSLTIRVSSNSNKNKNSNKNNNSNEINIRNPHNVEKQLKRAGLKYGKNASRKIPAKKSSKLGGVLQSTIPRRPYNHGAKLGSGQQGAVFLHKNNNNKVVKLRSFKKTFVYKENTEFTRALNNYYSKKNDKCL